MNSVAEPQSIMRGREAGHWSARAGEAGVTPCSRVSGMGGSRAGERAPGWLLTGMACVWGHDKALGPDRGAGAHHGKGTESLIVGFGMCL